MMIMTRSAADRWGIEWPPDVALMETDIRGRRIETTWSDLHDRRRERQRDRLSRIRQVPPPRRTPCYVWVVYVPGWIYSGWWCYVVTLRDSIAVNFQGFDRELALSIMESVPLGILPIEANFVRWMKELFKRRPRKPTGEDKRKAATIIGWLDNDRKFTLGKRRPLAV